MTNYELVDARTFIHSLGSSMAHTHRWRNLHTSGLAHFGPGLWRHYTGFWLRKHDLPGGDRRWWIEELGDDGFYPCDNFEHDFPTRREARKALEGWRLDVTA